jgi:ubiquinone/menaquinone biosynthesis C-methylase UbiE
MTEQNFRDKYEKSGRIGGWLIDRFYRAVGGAIARLDPPPATAFEVGAGEGYSTALLRGLLPASCRFESSEHEPLLAERAAARNPDVPFTAQSVYQLARGDASAELVICLEVLEHLDDPERGLAELARVAGRALIVSVPNEPLWRALNCARGKYLADLGNTPGHLNHWTPWAFERFVARRCRIVARLQPLPWTVVLAEPRR